MKSVLNKIGGIRILKGFFFLLTFNFILFTFHSKAEAFASLVQVKHVYPGQTATFDNPVKAGNLIVVFASGNQGSSSIATCNDSLGNSYTKVGSFMTSDGLTTRATAFYSWNVLGGTNTVSTTLTAATDIGITILEYAGIRNDIDPLDTYATSANSVADPIVAPLTTTAKDLIVYYWANESQNRYVAPNTGFTQVSYDSGHFDATGQLLTAERNTTHSPGIDVSSYADHSVLIALAFKVKRETLAKPPNNLGLVGYWSFEDATGTQATDFSGNGNNGTFTNGPTWADGKRGKAVNFDGNNDYLAVADSPSLDMTSGLTVCSWINVDDWTGKNARIIQKSGDSAQYRFLSEGTDFIFQVLSVQATTTLPSTGVWHHTCGTFDVGVNIKLYMDGSLVTTKTHASGMATSTDILYIGIKNAGAPASDAFDGRIDELRIYNRALSATEITALYGSGLRKVNSTAAGRGPTSGLVGHWTFDGQHLNTTTSTDVSGQANHGTLVSTPVPTIGKLGQGLIFNGSTNYVSIPYSATLTPSDAVTAAAWVKLGTGFDKGDVIGRDAQGSWGLSFYPGRLLQGSINGIARSRVTSALTQEVWTHVAMTYNTDGSGLKLYRNGVEVNDYDSQYTGTSTMATAVQPVVIGETVYEGMFNGSIDDVRVYNRALSASEILQLYRMGVSN